MIRLKKRREVSLIVLKRVFLSSLLVFLALLPAVVWAQKGTDQDRRSGPAFRRTSRFGRAG